MTAVEVVFWVSLGLIVYTHVGYPLLLRGACAGAAAGRCARSRRARRACRLIVAAHDEQDVIERKVENALALDYPPDRLEVIVASDGSTDRTVELARAAAAREARVRVLDLAAARQGPRPGRGGRARPRARSSPSRTRTRSGSADALRAGAPVRRPAGRLRVRAARAT